jgi:hypothetical protein
MTPEPLRMLTTFTVSTRMTVGRLVQSFKRRKADNDKRMLWRQRLQDKQHGVASTSVESMISQLMEVQRRRHKDDEAQHGPTHRSMGTLPQRQRTQGRDFDKNREAEPSRDEAGITSHGHGVHASKRHGSRERGRSASRAKPARTEALECSMSAWGGALMRVAGHHESVSSRHREADGTGSNGKVGRKRKQHDTAMVVRSGLQSTGRQVCAECISNRA